jgi:hypothetical protein
MFNVGKSSARPLKASRSAIFNRRGKANVCKYMQQYACSPNGVVKDTSSRRPRKCNPETVSFETIAVSSSEPHAVYA